MPLITLDDVSMAFGHVPLLDRTSAAIEAGERVAVIGRNGTGKSTLLRLLAGELDPDAGTIWRAPGMTSARLAQDPALSGPESVFDVVAAGLGALTDALTRYHAAARAVAELPTEAALAELGRRQHDLDERDGWRVEQRVELVLSRLSLTADAPVATLSGGWKRRVLLARALVSEPSLLLLDEPTNHLDIAAIEWLETLLAEYRGAVVVVTHDRAFLDRLSTRVLELDRGRLTSWPGRYAEYLAKKEASLENEAIVNAKFDRRMAVEEAWLTRGVKARRTRDEGRVRALMAMRAERAARRSRQGTAELQLETAERSGHVVFELDGVSFAYGGVPVLRDVSTRVLRGDRIGVIGPNGAGKTTLLRLLVGDLAPDRGDVRRGTSLQIAYFDQQREQLDPDRTVADTVADGNDMVTVGGVTRHVYGYLDDFLFPPERARSPVKSLSGGERNRLLLARLLARPANVLVLDEPTNDLDIETLERLEAELVAYTGTLLIVSHDRRFLDHVVTSTLVFEGEGRLGEYVGGYADWAARPEAPAPTAAPAAPAEPRSERASRPRPERPPRLSYREQREFDELPSRIEALEAERARLGAAIEAPDFYKEPAPAIAETLARLEEIGAEIEAAYRRWDELDSRT